MLVFRARHSSFSSSYAILGGRCGLTVERSLVRQGLLVQISAGPLPGNRLGQAAHTDVPLSPNNII